MSRGQPIPSYPNAPSAAMNERQLLEQIVLKLSGLPETLRQATVDHQWAQIPLFVDEWTYAAAQAANTALQLRAQTSGLELITSIVASIPAGATGTVQLGGMVLPIGAGVTVICPVQKVLATTDTRAVQSTVAGPCALWLTGQQLPTYGVLAQ